MEDPVRYLITFLAFSQMLVAYKFNDILSHVFISLQYMSRVFKKCHGNGLVVSKCLILQKLQLIQLQLSLLHCSFSDVNICYDVARIVVTNLYLKPCMCHFFQTFGCMTIDFDLLQCCNGSSNIYSLSISCTHLEGVQ